MSANRQKPLSERDAVQLFQKCAEVFEDRRYLTMASVAARLDCSYDYVRDHLSEFPGAWRMPGGDIRIPARDVEALAKDRRFIKEKATV